MLLAADLQPVGVEQQVSIIKQGHLRPLHQQEEDKLDKQHERQLPNAADVEEHGAGQQGQQHTVAEILQQGNTDLQGLLWECRFSLHHTFVFRFNVSCKLPPHTFLLF